MAHDDNKFQRPDAPPPPLFLGKKERDLVKQVNDELIERVIGQQIVYYPIDLETTNFHPLYGEAIEKNFLPPIHINALVEWEGREVTVDQYGIDRRTRINIHFHKRRLTEDQNVYVREGDFVCYGDSYYEIIKTFEPKELWGQTQNKVEIVAECLRAREGLFDGT